MSKTLIGIISYLPDDIGTRSIRLTTHIKQLKSLNDMFPTTDVLVMYQNYSPMEIDQCKQTANSELHLFQFESHGKLGANPARNRILKTFFNSEYDYLMLMDDDTVLYPYYDVKNFLNDLECFNNRGQIGMIRPVVPFMSPFKAGNYKDRGTIEQCWILRSCMGLIPFSMIILSNLKKVFNKEVYFDEVMNPQKGEGYDDYDFVFRLREKLIPCHRCSQIVVNPLYSDSTIYSDELRKRNHANNICNVYKRYPSLNVKYSIVDGKVKSDVSKLNVFEPVYIPRQHPYIFEKNMIPKDVPEGMSKLTRKRLF